MKDSEITEVFYQIARLLEKQAKSSKRNADPFSGQYKCLFLLDKAEKMSQQRLANILEIRATSLSEVLAKLEHKGYILREPSSTDKRTYDVSLTPEGRAEVGRVRRLRLEEHNELTEPLSQEEKEQLYRILMHIKDYYAGAEVE